MDVSNRKKTAFPTAAETLVTVTGEVSELFGGVVDKLRIKYSGRDDNCLVSSCGLLPCVVLSLWWPSRDGGSRAVETAKETPFGDGPVASATDKELVVGFCSETGRPWQGTWSGSAALVLEFEVLPPFIC